MENQNKEAKAARQEAAAYDMILTGGDLAEILASNGISDDEFREWVEDGSFADCAATLARRMAGVWYPYFLHAVYAGMRNGNVPAMKLYHELVGKSPAGMVGGAVSAEIGSLRGDLFGEE